MDITPTNKLPFHCIPTLDDKEGFRTIDSSVIIKASEKADGSISMVVEATREGADGRKLTGYSELPAAQVIALWAAFERLGKQHGFDKLVQTQAEFDEETRLRAEASSSAFDKHGQRKREERRSQEVEGNEGPSA